MSVSLIPHNAMQNHCCNRTELNRAI